MQMTVVWLVCDSSGPIDAYANEQAARTAAYQYNADGGAPDCYVVVIPVHNKEEQPCRSCRS